MINSPVKKIFITQVFGANPSMYAKFGLKGHNGIDYRAFLPSGNRAYSGGVSEVFAPHSGKIIENRLDSNGYGWYIKIENEKYGSVLGHFSQQSPLGVGSSVKIGQFVGFQGTTGNSTGIHLHWGFYKHPRNRANGYGGFINQQGLYKEYGASQEGELMEIDKVTFEKLVTKSTKYDEFVSVGYSEVKQVIDQKAELDKKISNYAEEIKGLNNQISLLNKDKQAQAVQIKGLQDSIRELNQDLEECQTQIPEDQDLEKDYEATGRRIIKVVGDTTIETSYKKK
jgi:murein DD-endopeptidase MepM/ murein hydrolase activator NlpD